MRNIIISVLAIFISACGSYNFVATPAPKEIVTMVYTTQSPSGSKTWRLINDNLKVAITSKSRSGKVTSSKTIIATYDQFELMVTNLEKSKFTESKSIPANSRTQTSETLIIETHAKTYTYTQNSTTRFPRGIQQAVSYITGTYK